jgi:hypothetical protein
MKMWIICGRIVSPTFGHRLYCRSIVDDYPRLEKHKVMVHHKHTPRLRQSSALSHGFTKLTCHLPRGLTTRTTSNWSIQTANNRDYTGTISTTTSHPRDIHVTSAYLKVASLIQERPLRPQNQPQCPPLGVTAKALVTWHCKQEALIVSYSIL